MKRHTNWALQVNADSVADEVGAEILRGVSKFGPYNSMHEAYAVIREELDEFWESVKADDPDPRELLQICATAQRAMLELCATGREEATK